MNPNELSKLLEWADGGKQEIYFAFGVNVEKEGLLILDRRQKGSTILHRLVEVEDQELTARRFGTVAVSSSTQTVSFKAHKKFPSHGENLLRKIIKETKYKRFAVVIEQGQAQGA
jgi:hypothetical protein